MEEKSLYWQRPRARGISRRRALAGGVALGMGAAAAATLGCRGDDGSGAAGTTKDAGPPQYGGVLRQATMTVAPHFSVYHRGAEGEVFHNDWRRTHSGYYDRLWGLRNTPDPARLIYLQLASSIEQVDELTVVAKMKEAFYHDQPQSKSNAKVNARQATAEDFAASFEFLKAGAVGEILFSSITTGEDLKVVTAIDRLTLRYDMYRPLAFFYESTTAGATSAFAIPKEMLDTDALKQDVPIGTGPFMFKSYQLASIEDAVRNPNYHVKGRPYLDGKRLVFVPDSAAQEAAFRANQIDAMGFSNIHQRDSVAGALGNRIHVVTVPAGGTLLCFLSNIHRKPFDDVRVREAMYRSIDVDRIINIVWFGDAVRSWFFKDTNYTRFPVGFKAVEKYVGYDPKKAADLLRAANVDPNKTYDLMVPVEAQTWVDAGRLAAEDWSKVGLKVRLDPQVRSIYLSRAGPKPGDFDITMSVPLDYAFMRTVVGGFWENTTLQDAEIDAVVEQIIGTMDAEKRKDLSQKFELMLAQKYANFMPMLAPNSHTGIYSFLKGRDTEMSNTGLGGWQLGLWIDK
jgi:peptide/nickel transport system substrate-binding protein